LEFGLSRPALLAFAKLNIPGAGRPKISGPPSALTRGSGRLFQETPLFPLACSSLATCFDAPQNVKEAKGLGCNQHKKY